MLRYNMYPIRPGKVQLPKLHISLPKPNKNIDALAQNMLPKFVFVTVSYQNILTF